MKSVAAMVWYSNIYIQNGKENLTRWKRASKKAKANKKKKKKEEAK